jgi:hypothetical protein
MSGDPRRAAPGPVFSRGLSISASFLGRSPTWEGEVEIRRMYEEEDDVREVQIEGSRALEDAGRPRDHERV